MDLPDGRRRNRKKSMPLEFHNDASSGVTQGRDLLKCHIPLSKSQVIKVPSNFFCQISHLPHGILISLINVISPQNPLPKHCLRQR